LSLFIIINLTGVEKLHEVNQNIRVPVRKLVQHHLTIPALRTGAKPSHSEHQIFHLILCAATEDGLSSIFMRLNERFFIEENY